MCVLLVLATPFRGYYSFYLSTYDSHTLQVENAILKMLVFLKLSFDCNGRRFTQRHSDEKIGQRFHFECLIEMQDFFVSDP